jgi:hypothetical protein
MYQVYEVNLLQGTKRVIEGHDKEFDARYSVAVHSAKNKEKEKYRYFYKEVTNS